MNVREGECGRRFKRRSTPVVLASEPHLRPHDEVRLGKEKGRRQQKQLERRIRRLKDRVERQCARRRTAHEPSSKQHIVATNKPSDEEINVPRLETCESNGEHVCEMLQLERALII